MKNAILIWVIVDERDVNVLWKRQFNGNGFFNLWFVCSCLVSSLGGVTMTTAFKIVFFCLVWTKPFHNVRSAADLRGGLLLVSCVVHLPGCNSLRFRIACKLVTSTMILFFSIERRWPHRIVWVASKAQQCVPSLLKSGSFYEKCFVLIILGISVY